LKRKNLFLSERSGDVYENKGSAFHSPELSGNIHENKGDMSRKGNVVENTGS
jgi:hypothetical protein